jgi:hypothetical protein
MLQLDNTNPTHAEVAQAGFACVGQPTSCDAAASGSAGRVHSTDRSIYAFDGEKVNVRCFDLLISPFHASNWLCSVGFGSRKCRRRTQMHLDHIRAPDLRMTIFADVLISLAAFSRKHELPDPCAQASASGLAGGSKMQKRSIDGGAPVNNVRLPTCFRAQTASASHSDKTYGYPARKICVIKGMTLETDGELFLNRWFVNVCHA